MTGFRGTGHLLPVSAAGRRLRLVALAILVVASAGFRHDVHVSNARVALEGRSAYIRVRLFREDLQDALRAHVRQTDFRLAVTPHADSVATSYAAAKLVLRSGTHSLKPTLIGSGEEKGIRPELDIWWLDLRYDSAVPLRDLEITNELMFEQFRDQMNIMKVRLPSGGEKTIVLVPGEGSHRLKF